MVSGPSEIFVRGPVPAAVGPDPVSICIGLPTAGRVSSRRRLIDVAIVIIIKPVAVRRETIVEYVIVTGFVRRVAIGVTGKIVSGARSCHGLIGSVSRARTGKRQRGNSNKQGNGSARHRLVYRILDTFHLLVIQRRRSRKGALNC